MKLKILAAMDGSRASAAALRFAAGLASASGGTLTVATVSEISPGLIRQATGRGALSAFEKAERRFVRAAFERARRLTKGLSVHRRVEYWRSRQLEPFAVTIARGADRLNADLIVLGSRGGTITSRWLLGSIANRLVHLASRPVTLVRSGVRGRRRLRRILVATDGSQAAQSAVRFAARLAREIPRSRLILLTVSTLGADLALTAPGLVRSMGWMAELDAAEGRAAREILRKAAGGAGAGTRPLMRHYRPRNLFGPDAILREAKRLRADVIILGRTGRSALGDVLMGSVAQRVLTRATQPVILVPARRKSRRGR